MLAVDSSKADPPPRQNFDQVGNVKMLLPIRYDKENDDQANLQENH